jgi:spermidine synthase
MTQANPNRLFLYTISFIEGAAVMSAELIGAKMLAPYFGSSLYVWATVMAVTLGGLAAGYFTGGYWAGRSQNPKLLFYVLLVAAVFTAAMPISASIIIAWSAHLSFLTSIIFSTILFLMPPVFLMGMVSPLIIEKLSDHQHHAGNMAGNIYAVSTVGGIIATFGMGFYIIPTFGLSKPAFITGVILGLLPLIAIIKQRKIFLIASLLLMLFGKLILTKETAISDIKILYSKEGLLGQIMVVDYPVYQQQQTPVSYIRMMLFNRVIQTYDNQQDTAHRYFPYVSLLVDEASKQVEGKKALLLGLGGGVVANELIKNNFDVDAVEFDERVVYAAQQYFSLNKRTNVFVDDARRYINNTQKKYDLIVFDVFKGEENPSHLITEESLSQVKALLNKNGMLVINNYGFKTGEKSKGIKAIVRTLKQSAFNYHLLSSAAKEEEGNILIFASQYDFKTSHKSFQFESQELSKVPLLCDDKPILDLLNKEAAASWRNLYMATAIKDFNQRNIPLFN